MKPAAIAVVIMGLLMVFQILLAAGLPLGRAAWGGEHSVLPSNLRVGSLLAVLILGFAVYVVLARSGFLAPGAGSRPLRIITWAYAGYFSLNVLMNALSGSPPERYIMTPVAAVLVICLVLVARSEPAGRR
jgi:hypothetical protein